MTKRWISREWYDDDFSSQERWLGKGRPFFADYVFTF